jgi:hypothetical protein
MKTFRTHLIVSKKDVDIIKDLEFSNHSLILKDEPTSCYWESKDGSSFTHYIGGINQHRVRENYRPQRELIIEAESEEDAEDLLSIIHGGMLLAYPEPSLTSNFTSIAEEIDYHDNRYKEHPFRNYFKQLENIGFGCQIAHAALEDKEIIYAIAKYKISLELYSLTPHSADPGYGQVFNHYDLQHQNHARSAFAIISAFSVIEELGLEVRSSNKNPRFTDKISGTWNEKVLGDIKERLENSGISNEQTFDWIYRGSPTRIENNIQPFFGFDSQWVVYGEDVRDKTLTFPEAIHNASYLRNFIAAHKFNELTQYISPYDVFNVQCLARQLILMTLGFWHNPK